VDRTNNFGPLFLSFECFVGYSNPVQLVYRPKLIYSAHCFVAPASVRLGVDIFIIDCFLVEAFLAGP
jgi:hypothetical protein